MSAHRVALVLRSCQADEETVTALQLAERLLARGVRVTVYAHGDAAALAAGDDAIARAVGALVRRGVHGATLDWVADAEGCARLGATASLVPGVVPGDPADLWSFVRDADLVLSVGGVR